MHTQRQLFIALLWLMAVAIQAQHKQGGVLPNMRRDIKVATVLDTAQVVVYYAFNADDIHNEGTYTDRQWLLVGLHNKINTNYWKTVDPRNTQVPDTPYSPLEKE